MKGGGGGGREGGGLKKKKKKKRQVIPQGVIGQQYLDRSQKIRGRGGEH